MRGKVGGNDCGSVFYLKPAEREREIAIHVWGVGRVVSKFKKARGGAPLTLDGVIECVTPSKRESRETTLVHSGGGVEERGHFVRDSHRKVLWGGVKRTIKTDFQGVE